MTARNGDRIDISNLTESVTADGWLMLRTADETHHVRLGTITAWSHNRGRGRVYLYTQTGEYVVSCRPTTATLDQPSRYAQVEDLADRLAGALFGHAHPVNQERFTDGL